MCAIFDKYGPSIPETGQCDNDRQKDLETPHSYSRGRPWTVHSNTVSLGTLPISKWTFPGRKAAVRKDKRAAFKKEIRRTVCYLCPPALPGPPNYRKAVVADVQTKNKRWDAVNRSFDWGPLVDEDDDDDDEVDDDE